MLEDGCGVAHGSLTDARSRSTTRAARCGSSSTTRTTAESARRRSRPTTTTTASWPSPATWPTRATTSSLVTKDLPLRLKAAIVGLEADEYRNELAGDTGWTGFAELDVDAARSSTPCSPSAPSTWPTARRSCPCNTGVALQRRQRSRRSAGVRDDKRVHLVRRRPVASSTCGAAPPSSASPSTCWPTTGSASCRLGGPAGTGKSVLALAAGLEAVLEERTHNRVIVFRPLFAVGGQDLGYLPGSEAEKMMPVGRGGHRRPRGHRRAGGHRGGHRARPARGAAPHPHPRAAA